LRDLHLFLIHFFRATHLVRHILEALLACLLGLAVVIGLAEHRSFADALYFTLITGLTVGYGDISPVTPLGRVASIAAALIGVISTGIYVAIATNAVSRALQAKIPREPTPNVNAPG
jgi:voltage-gated potassium channel